MGSAKDIGRCALNSPPIQSKASITMGDSIEDDDSTPDTKVATPESGDKRARVIELFTAYDIADDKVSECKAALEAATKERSDIVHALADTIAPKKRLTRSGKEYTIVARGDSFFFRSSKEESFDI